MTALELLRAIVEHGFYERDEDGYTTCCFFCGGVEEESEEYRQVTARNSRRAEREPMPSLRDLFNQIYGEKTPLTPNQRSYGYRKHKEALKAWAERVGIEPTPLCVLEMRHKPDCLWLQAKTLVEAQ